MKNKNGFTLIEILIASAIFVTVTAIALGVFTSTSRVQEKTTVIRETNQTARLAIESIGRDLRLATSFTILQSVLLAQPANLDLAQGKAAGEAVILIEVDPSTGTSTTRLYGLSDYPGRTGLKTIVVQENNGEFLPLLPPDVALESLEFSGIGSNLVGGAVAVQPYITIKMTLATSDGRASNRQILSTTITNRAYLWSK